MNQLCLTYEFVTSHIKKNQTIENSNLHGFEVHGPSSKDTKLLLQVIKAIINQCLNHASRMNYWCLVDEWVMSHEWMSHVSHMYNSCLTYEWMSHVKHATASCLTHEWVISHIWMSRVTPAEAPKSCGGLGQTTGCPISCSLPLFYKYIHYMWAGIYCKYAYVYINSYPFGADMPVVAWTCIMGGRGERKIESENRKEKEKMGGGDSETSLQVMFASFFLFAENLISSLS